MLILRARVLNTVQVDERHNREGEVMSGYKKIQVVVERPVRGAPGQVNMEMVNLYLGDISGVPVGRVIEVPVWPYVRGKDVAFSAPEGAVVRVVDDREMAA